MNPIILDFIHNGGTDWKATRPRMRPIYLCHKKFQLLLPDNYAGKTVRLTIFNQKPGIGGFYYRGTLICNCAMHHIHENWYMSMPEEIYKFYNDEGMTTLCRELAGGTARVEIWFTITVI